MRIVFLANVTRTKDERARGEAEEQKGRHTYSTQTQRRGRKRTVKHTEMLRPCSNARPSLRRRGTKRRQQQGPGGARASGQQRLGAAPPACKQRLKTHGQGRSKDVR